MRELRLRIGFLSSYSGQELHLAVAEFSRTYPEVSIDIIGGTHEELYRMLQNGSIDMALNDQRRAFSDKYENFRLSSCACCIELSSSDPLAIPDRIDISQLQRKTCILVSPVQERKTEENYYQEILGYGSSYLFAENLPEARLMTVGGRGFLPVDQVGTLPAPEPGLVRRPVFRDSEQLRRSYCVFWKKKNSGYYIEEFAGMLRDLLSSERGQS
ncbi:MAG: substrate-binding domain-containing protein [Eubacteriaceae bacterium]|jgi:DNA-binding transcriptional LysR family regulator